MLRMLSEVSLLALAVSAISVTVTRSSVTAKMRRWVKKRSLWVGKLTACPYCFAHWVSLVAALVYKPVSLGPWWADLITSTFAITALAGIVAGVIMHLIHFAPDDDTADTIEQLRSALMTARATITRQQEEIERLRNL